MEKTYKSLLTIITKSAEQREIVTTTRTPNAIWGKHMHEQRQDGGTKRENSKFKKKCRVPKVFTSLSLSSTGPLCCKSGMT
jgi:hypothetical protein